MRRVLTALGLAVLVGGTTGVLARVLMRAVAVLGKNALELHLAVTAGIALFFVLALVPGAVTAAFTARWWRWVVGAPTTVPLLLGGFGIAASDVQDARGRDLSALRWVLIYTLAAVILALVVAQLVVVVRLVDRALGRRQDRTSRVVSRAQTAAEKTAT